MSVSLHNLLIALVTLVSTHEKQDMVPGESQIRELLAAIEFKDDEENQLAKLGGYSPTAFPLYRRILDDPKEDHYLVTRTLWVLGKIKSDRSQFADLAIAKLAHPRGGVRHSAVELLAQIGSGKDVGPVVALLSDKDWTVSIAAAKTLVAIGDQRTVAAMDVWLNSSSPRADRNEKFDEGHRKDIAKYRDELKARLEKAMPPSK